MQDHPVQEPLFESAEFQAERNRGLKIALRLLGKSDKFEQEIARNLQAKGLDDQVIQSVLFELKRRTIINDKLTTQNHIERKSGTRSIGPEKLKAELLKRGAPEEIVEECLQAISPQERRDGMMQALRRKFEPAGDRIKAGRFLFSRGFTEDEIEEALDSFFHS